MKAVVDSIVSLGLGSKTSDPLAVDPTVVDDAQRFTIQIPRPPTPLWLWGLLGVIFGIPIVYFLVVKPKGKARG